MTSASFLQQFHIQAQRLQLADEHVERLRQAGIVRDLAFDDGLVDLRASFDVVRLDGEQFLQRVRGAVRFESPHFHLSEALAAELRLAAEGLLGDERVGADRARVDLVVHEVRQLQHVDEADADLLLEALAGHAVVEVGLAVVRQAGRFELRLDLRLRRAVEHRRGEVEAERARGPAEVRLQDLADVHARGDAERIQNDLHRRAVRHVRHVFLGQDAADDALVAVASGHLVADRELALHGHVDLDHLDHAGRELVALLQVFAALLGFLLEHAHAVLGALDEHADRLARLLVHRQRQQLAAREAVDRVARRRLALLHERLARAEVDHVALQLLVREDVGDALVARVGDDADLVLDVAVHPVDLRLLDRLGAGVLLHALGREDLHVDAGALAARSRLERGVADVAGLLAEDRAEQLLLGRQLRLALRRDLADEDVALLDRGADADDAGLVEVAQRRLRDVRDVARDLLGAELRVAGFDLEFLDVDGGVVVLLDQLLGDENGVLEVVAAPRHERDEDVAAEGELAGVGAGAVGEDLALAHALAFRHGRLLGDAGVLVRALELDELVDVGAELLRLAGLDVLGLDADDDAVGIDEVNHAAALADDDGAGVAGPHVLHPGADQRRLGAEQRHGLALHVRAHERAVHVCVLEERHERGGHGDELLGRDVDEIDLLFFDGHEVARLPGDDTVVNEVSVLVDDDVRLRDRVALLIPRGEVERVRLGLGELQLAALLGRRRVLLGDAVVLFLEVALLDDLSEGERRIADLDDAVVVEHAPVVDLLVRRLDEAVFVDARVARQRRDETDVRAFRRLDRADAAVVRRMNVAYFEPGALARETSWSKGRQAALVRDLGERVRLVHELRQLRRAEELLDRGDDRLGVDEVVRHRGVDVLMHRHLFLDGALHAHQADAELVLQELAGRAHAAVAEVVDVVDAADVLAQAEQVVDDDEEVLGAHRLLRHRRVEVELDVELEAAHAREVVLAGVEEHAFEQRLGRLQRRRIAGAHAAVDLDDGRFEGLRGVLAHGVEEDVADEDASKSFEA